MQKTAIVTGAYGNLGQAVVKKFIREGYKVAGSMMPGEAMPPDFPEDGFTGSAVDLTNEDDTKKWVDGIIASHGTVDAAVFTVGGFAMGVMADTRLSDIQRQYQLNFETSYNAARPVFAQMMRQQQGRIFFIGARPGLQATFSNGMVAYGLAKSLVFRLAELMNLESKGMDVVTAVVVPSTIDTPANRKSMPDADFTAWVKATDIADTIFFHCQPEATAIRETVIKMFGNL
ncbi:MAG: SDR family NAD(P)-dependent oxidoreductase [Bacteroidetes bacterium]|nr:SDR family NAD(P)-dependent oxidoreductase [Bacteroidota bacterium]